jgi:glycosyltransferase involved in cell wall biosynthesis
MRNKSIYFTYHHVEKPWGGANNFMRAFRQAIQESGTFDILETPSRDCNVLFMNQLGRGPAQGSGQYSLREIKRMRGPKTRLIVRAINLRRNHPGYTIRTFFNSKMRDIKALALLHTADHVIFQSQYQKDMFFEYGFKGSSWSVVYNGAARVFRPAESALPLDNDKLRILSCAFGGRRIKLHSLMAELSKCEGVNMHYAGTWPANVDPANVQQYGVLVADEIAALWRTMHYCFHPAVKDICPNVVCEALASGVPVIYNPKPGGAVEMASSTGIALRENDLATTAQEARLWYETAVHKTRAVSERFGIGRAMEEYVRIIQRYTS